MAPAVDSRPNTSSLAQSADTVSNLISRFQTSLSQSSRTTQELPADAPNPLAVLHTSATLLKAHTTKLSLLLINKPFTPSAIQRIIANDIAGSCLPAIMSAVEICDPKTYTAVLAAEVQARVSRLLRELDALMKEVVMLAQAGSDGAPNTGDDSIASRDSLSSTGVVWNACDALMDLQSLGLAGVVVRRAEEYRETLEDAIEELRQWSEDDQDEAAETEEEATSDDDIFSLGSLPKDRPDLKILLESHLKKLNLTRTLYKALVKRRLKVLPPLKEPPGNLKSSPSLFSTFRFDQLMELLKRIPDEADDLASAYYELDEKTAEVRMKKICTSATEAAKLVRRSWEDGEDDFTIWSVNFESAIAGNPVASRKEAA